jgi:FMN phosphatase YigB (HAD superfamily)
MKSKNIKAYCFDFDETLVTTDAKVNVYVNGVFSRSLTSKQYNTYKPKPNERLDYTEFRDPELILNAKKYKMWPVIANISKAIKADKSSSKIFILTARDNTCKPYIYEYLKKNGIAIKLDDVLTLESGTNISEEKRHILQELASKYKTVLFFDDDKRNVAIAQSIPGVETRLVENLNEDMGGVGAPMATLSNTPGMGNATPASMSATTGAQFTSNAAKGSGDLWGKGINKKPYTQSSVSKRKRKKSMKKKKVQEAFIEKSDPIRDMGIGKIKGLWDYTPEEAAVEIWLNRKPWVQKGISEARRYGSTYTISPLMLTYQGCKSLAFEPDNEMIIVLAKLLQKEIDKSIKDYTIIISPNVKYLRTNDIDESNINPYDKIGTSMAKKMKVKAPFKRVKSSKNQNAMKQSFEHEIITLDEYTKSINESWDDGNIKVSMKEYDRRFPSTNQKPMETTIGSLWDGGWKIDANDIEKLKNGESVQLYSGMYRSISLKKI